MCVFADTCKCCGHEIAKHAFEFEIIDEFQVKVTVMTTFNR